MMLSYIEEIENYLNKHDMIYDTIHDKEIIHFIVSVDDYSWKILIRMVEKKQLVTVYSCFMTKFPENKREMVSEYINRVNYGTILGNFEIDMNDGEVHYKTSVNYEHVNLE